VYPLDFPLIKLTTIKKEKNKHTPATRGLPLGFLAAAVRGVSVLGDRVPSF